MKITIFVLILSIFTFSACQTTTENAPVLTKTAASGEIKHVPVGEAKEAVSKSDAQFIDVRTPAEYKGVRAANAVNMPLDSLENDLAGLDREKAVYVICETGSRSKKGAEILQKAGFKEIYNVQGGTSEWVKAGLPAEKGE